MSRKTGRIVDAVTQASVFNPIKNAMAANAAHAANEARLDAKDAKEGKTHGVVYRAFESAGDAVADVANIATLGGYRTLTNMFDDAESRINRKGMKEAKKEGRITGKSTVEERSQVYLNESLLATEFNVGPASSEEADAEPDVD